MKISAWIFYVMPCLFLLQCGSDNKENKPAVKEEVSPPVQKEAAAAAPAENAGPLLPDDLAGAEKRFIEIVKEYQAALERHLENCAQLKKETVKENRRIKRNEYAEKYMADYMHAYTALMTAQQEYMEKAGFSAFQKLFEKHKFLNAVYAGEKGKRRSLPARESPCRP